MSFFHESTIRSTYNPTQNVVVTASSKNLPLRFGVFELDLDTGELRKSGRAVRLRPQAAKLLGALASRPGQLVTREDLQEELWGQETFVDFEHGINLCIREIRTALGDDAATPRYVETLPRHGYRFIAPIHDTYQSAKDSAVDLQRAAPTTATTPINPAPRRSYRPVALFGAVVLAIVIAAGGGRRMREFRGGSSAVKASGAPIACRRPKPAVTRRGLLRRRMTEAITTDGQNGEPR
jgi:DNA-binding winged helix-turn-helix (wHTH) protein